MFRAMSPDDYSMSTGEVATYIETRTGIRPSPSNLSRWRQKGVGGKILEAHKLGGRYYMSRRSVDEFLEKTDIVSLTRPAASPAKIVTDGLRSKLVDRRSRLEAERSAAEHEQAKQFLASRLNMFKFLLCC